MFAVIRHYHFNPKDGAEIDRRIREEFVPIVKKAKGFVRYYWLDTGEGEGASFGVRQIALTENDPRDAAADRRRNHSRERAGGEPSVGQQDQPARRHHRAIPSSDVDATAWKRRGIRPDP